MLHFSTNNLLLPMPGPLLVVVGHIMVTKTARKSKENNVQQKGSCYQRAYSLVVNTLIKSLQKNVIPNSQKSYGEKVYGVIEAYNRSRIVSQGQFASR